VAIVGLDYLFAYKNNLNLVELWNNSIDTLIKIEDETSSSNKSNAVETKKEVLTEEKALNLYIFLNFHFEILRNTFNILYSGY
jgi:hypothetical protein